MERERDEAGFTLLEVLVATGLSSLLMGIIVGGVLFNQRIYYEAVVRLGINSNLRSAVDIVSMNIRQAGENMSDTFPAVIVENGAVNGPDTLRLRRNVLSDVMTLCVAVAAGATTLQTSVASSSNPACVPANVTSTYNAFQAYRTANSNSVRLYLYDRTAKSGEFVNYTNESIVSTTHRLTVSATGAAYPVTTTGLYMIEEYAFSMNSASKTLELVTGGQTATPQTVSFNFTNFQVRLRMDDNTTQDSLLPSNTTYDWKNIRQIQLTLTGQDQRKTRTFTSSITSEYFPRNVLSE